MGFPGNSNSKESVCNDGDLGSMPELGRSPGRGRGNSLQYSCLENPMDGGAWWATAHGIAELDTTEHTQSVWIQADRNRRRPLRGKNNEREEKEDECL